MDEHIDEHAGSGDNNHGDKMTSKKKFLLLLPILIIIAIIAFGVWLYTGSLTQAKQNIFKKTSLPVAMVGNHFISGKEFVNRLELAKSLLQGEKSFDENQVKNQIITQLEENQKLAAVAQAHGVSVSADAVDSEYKVFVQNFAKGDDKKFEDTLNKTYKLSPSDFKAKVLQPDLLTTALTVWYNKQESLNSATFKKQKGIQAKLDAGTPFSDVAKALSEDETTKQLGGDTGFVASADLLPEFGSELKGLKLNDQKQIISRFGIHTVKVLEIDPANASRYHLAQIFVKGAGYEKWYADQAANIKTRNFIKIETPSTRPAATRSNTSAPAQSTPPDTSATPPTPAPATK